MMKISNLLMMILMFISIIYSQNQQRRGDGSGMAPIGIIKGKISDSETKKPIEYANIVLFRLRDSVMINGCISNPTGEFKLENLMPGRYYAKISFMGYSTKTVDNIQITPNAPIFNFGDMVIKQTNIKLKEVTTTGEKEMIINNLDKKVINVDKDLTSMGGSAVDVMQNIPSVAVDADGNISLRGNTNITILIDGRPSGMAGLNNSDVLNQIPASAIESIELVTNPSARYDPEGTAGIINLVLKKKSNLGMNGIISANIGTRDKFNSSINLNLRNSEFNMFGSYDGRINNMSGSGSTNRFSSVGVQNTDLNQAYDEREKMFMHSLNTGMDYNINDFNTLTFAFQYRSFGHTENQNSVSNIYNTNKDIIRTFDRKTIGDDKVNSFNLNLNFKRTFESKGHELTADIMYSDNKMDGNQNTEQTELNSVLLQKSINANTNKTFLAQANYILPTETIGRIETGYKITLQDMGSRADYENFDNISQQWINQTELKNYFNYKQNVYALYFIYSNNIDLFKYQFGLRAEEATAKGSQDLNKDEYSKNYFSIYPTIHFSQTLFGEHEISLSYSRRVDRPNNRQLNPHLDMEDSLNLRYGNPDLNPQYINSFELGYSALFNRTAITTNLFYKRTTDIISNISTIDTLGVTRTTYKNLYRSNNFGVEAIFNSTIFDWWKLMTTFTYFKMEYDDQLSSNNLYSWMVRLNTNFTIMEGFTLQFIANYNAPMITPQGKRKAMYGLDFAAKKDFFDGKLSVNLRVSDVLNSRKHDSETYGTGFTMYSNRAQDSRNIFLGLQYRLNNFKSRDDERRRVNEEGMGEEDF